MNTISFMSANYVARQVGYRMTGGWGQGDRATNEYFKPLATYAGRFDEMLQDVRTMGFEALDLWTSHLNLPWATDEHIAIARDLLQKHGLQVASLAGWFGATPEQFERACQIAVGVGTKVLGGSTSLVQQDRPSLVALLKQHDLVLGIENHPNEKTPADILTQVGDGGDGRIGTTVDTGWWGTQGYDAARAIEELAPHIVHVHLKDVLAPGGHETCRYGRGCVPVERCVQTLRRLGYTGAISVEHEPEMFDPTEDCIAGFAMLRGWLA
jgi:sugar phosphate isomerase/epimerase